MKRKISISMGLSLVAVFAIIATLGLLSLDQAGTAHAQTAGTIAVDSVMLEPNGNGLPTNATVMFRSGDDLDAYDVNEDGATDDEGHQIRLTFSSFTLAGDGAFSAALDDDDIMEVVVIEAGGMKVVLEDDHVAVVSDVLVLNVPDMDPDTSGMQGIDAMEVITVTVMGAQDTPLLTNPTNAGQHSVTVGTQEIVANDDNEDEISRMIFVDVVGPSLSEVMASLNPPEVGENAELVVYFKTSHEVDADNDTVVITLPEGFSVNIPTDTVGTTEVNEATMTTWVKAGDMADYLEARSASSIGRVIAVGVPDLDDTEPDDQGIPAGSTGAIKFQKTANIMTPMASGDYVIKVSTTSDGTAVAAPAVDATETILTPMLRDVEVMADPPTKGMRTELSVTFTTATTLGMDDAINVLLPMGFAISDAMDASDVSVSASRTGEANRPRRATNVESRGVSEPEMVQVTAGDTPMVSADGTVGYYEVSIDVPDMDEDAANDSMAAILPGSSVTVTFSNVEGSEGITNPADTGTYMVGTSSSVIQGLPAEDDGESRVYFGSVEIMEAAVPVVPDPIAPTGVMVMADPDTAGAATRLTVRFMTGPEGALEEDGEITVMLGKNFGVPASIDSEDVTINGAAAKSVAANMDTGEIILTLDAGILADRTVSVVFKVGADLTNPTTAGSVDVFVSTTEESLPTPFKLNIVEAPKPREFKAIRFVPQIPGESSTITLKFQTKQRLSSIENSEIIFRFHDDFKIEGGRIDTSKVTIQADSIFGGPEVDTPKASGVVHPTSATVTYETTDREPQIRLAVPDMADDEGDQHILANATVTVIFQQGSGITNPSEASSYFIKQAIDDDSTLTELGKITLPVVMSLSGDGGKRGASVARGVEGGEAALFWLDTASMKIPTKKTDGPDGIYDPNGERGDKESVLCRATAESNDTATCVFAVANPPFSPNTELWVNVQDSEGRRVGTLKADPNTPYDWKKMDEEIDDFDFKKHPIYHAFVKLDARVAVSPSEVNIGDTVTVSMSDYPPGPVTQIKIGSVTLPQSYVTSAGTVPASGQHTFTFDIPATVGGTPIPLGKVRVDVNGTDAPGDADDFKADTNITIAGARVTLSQNIILGNQTLSISGSGFSGRAAGGSRCIEQGGVLINNVPVEILEVEDSGQCDDAVELTSSGTFTLSVILRNDLEEVPDPLQTAGTHAVVVTDSKGVEGRTTVEIPERTLDVNPKTARPRTAVTVSGRNFVADNPDGSSVAVALKYDCGGRVTRTVSAEPDASGNFEETLRVPETIAASLRPTPSRR